jgi:hypothetical protein
MAATPYSESAGAELPPADGVYSFCAKPVRAFFV